VIFKLLNIYLWECAVARDVVARDVVARRRALSLLANRYDSRAIKTRHANRNLAIRVAPRAVTGRDPFAVTRGKTAARGCKNTPAGVWRAARNNGFSPGRLIEKPIVRREH